jgi:hypothetical protein
MLLVCPIYFIAIVRWPVVQMARAEYPLVGRSSQGNPISFRNIFSVSSLSGMGACLGVWSQSLSSDSLKWNSSSSSRWVIAVLIYRSSFRVIRDGSNNIMYHINCEKTNKIAWLVKSLWKRQPSSPAPFYTYLGSCENLSMLPLILSLPKDLSPGPCLRTTWSDDSWLSPVFP